MGEYLAQVYVVAAFFLGLVMREGKKRMRARALAGTHDQESFEQGGAIGIVLSAMVAFIVLAVCEVFGG